MRVVIVGAGQAGGWATRTLRDYGFTGEIILIGQESHPPYQRPPLSKEILLGHKQPDSTYLWPSGLHAEFIKETRVREIDREAKRVHLSNGHLIGYDKLILANGGRARRLGLPGAHYLLTIEDAVALLISLLTGESVLVFGGGWIGLEAAAA